MPVELRKRKAHQQPSAAPLPKKSNGKPAAKPKKAAASNATEKVEEPAAKAEEKETSPEETASKEESKSSNKAVEKEETSPAEASKEEKKSSNKAVAAGDKIDLKEFGGEIENNDGEKTSLKKLVDDSDSGVVLFTYPKASTPGCES